MNLLKIFRKKGKSLNLYDLHVLRGNSYPCDKCSIENKYCHKLIFSDRTICVTPKDKVNSFRSKPHRVRKPVSKI